MKYTVMIRQPVPEEVRDTLESQLSARFNLSPEQAKRLAGRKTGRLMKPTSQARAELLLQVFQSVNAQVILEECHDEDREGKGFDTTIGAPATDTSLSHFGGSGNEDSSADPFAASEKDPLANALLDWQRTGTNQSNQPDAFADGGGGGHSAPPFDPFAAPTPPSTPTPPLDVSMPTSPAADQALFTTDAVQVNKIDGNMGSVGSVGGGIGDDFTSPPSGLGSSSKLEAAIAAMDSQPASEEAGKDDWSDFTGALTSTSDSTETAPDTSPPQDAAIVVDDRQGTEFFTAIEDEAINNMPRTSVATQIRFGTFVPIVLSGILSAGLLAFTLPNLQHGLIQQNAQSIATALGPNLSTNEERALRQIDRIITDPNIGFVRVEYPDGGSIFRSKSGQTTDPQYNEQVAEWIKVSPNGGKVNLGGTNYLASRITVVVNKGTSIISTNNQSTSENFKQRVTVGLTMKQATSVLRDTLLYIGLATVIGLLVATILAGQAANAISAPLRRLVEVADAISLGDLSRPVKAERHDEIGELAQALERMRFSLDNAISRLRERRNKHN